MATTRFKGETAGERLDYTSISDADMVQVRHKPGTIEDADKGISKSQLQSCPFGVCDTSSGTAAKAASLTDSNPDFTLVSGREVVVCFTTANTASNPTLNFAGSGAIPLYMPNGAPVGAWNAGAWMHLKYFYATVGNSQIQRWILMSQEVDSEVIMASSTAITGKSLVSGASIKIMFTSDITGSNTSTVLSLTYNGTAYNVKVGKNGSLSNFVASEVSTGVYKYVQAYTTLELAFDGSQFIIIGNPVVLSSADYTIYADGKIIKEYTVIEHSDGTRLAPGGYYEKNINFITEQGFSIVSYTAQQIGTIDAFLFNLHLFPSFWRITIYNCASVEQTMPDITIKLLCVKN